jgi:hypothetical protein
MSAPILFMTLLLSACAYLPKAVAPVAKAKPVVKEQSVVDEQPVAQEQPAVDNQPAVTEEKPPVQLPAIPLPKRRDHNIEED